MISTDGQAWTFFRAFVRAPRVVASMIPSSPSATRRVLAAADVGNARTVVEFGAGTGGITRALLDAMPAQAHLLAIERTAAFIEPLAQINDDRLAIVHGCASRIATELAERGWPQADAVVSGIPFSTMPPELSREIIEALDAALRPGGRFVAYQFTDRVAVHAQPVLGTPRVEYEILNIPPLRVFTWHKADTGPARERARVDEPLRQVS